MQRLLSQALRAQAVPPLTGDWSCPGVPAATAELVQASCGWGWHKGCGDSRLDPGQPKAMGSSAGGEDWLVGGVSRTMKIQSWRQRGGPRGQKPEGGAVGFYGTSNICPAPRVS